jgi:hypothetical protein
VIASTASLPYFDMTSAALSPYLVTASTALSPYFVTASIISSWHPEFLNAFKNSSE